MVGAYIYCTGEGREEVFEILEGIVSEGTDHNRGRSGMELWRILVLDPLRLNCDWDYDKLKEIADNHRTLRLMPGHGIWDESSYPLQTLKDNVSLLTPEVFRKAKNLKRSGARDKKKRTEREKRIMEAHQAYIDLAASLLERVEKMIQLFRGKGLVSEDELFEIGKYMAHAQRHGLYRTTDHRVRSNESQLSFRCFSRNTSTRLSFTCSVLWALYPSF